MILNIVFNVIIIKFKIMLKNIFVVDLKKEGVKDVNFFLLYN